MYLSKPVECTTPRVSHIINYGPCGIMMCQCRCINWNKCTTLVEDVDNGGHNACYGDRGYLGNLCAFTSILL